MLVYFLVSVIKGLLFFVILICGKLVSPLYQKGLIVEKIYLLVTLCLHPSLERLYRPDRLLTNAKYTNSDMMSIRIIEKRSFAQMCLIPLTQSYLFQDSSQHYWMSDDLNLVFCDFELLRPWPTDSFALETLNNLMKSLCLHSTSLLNIEMPCVIPVLPWYLSNWHIQYHVSWCPSAARNHDISRHVIFLE